MQRQNAQYGAQAFKSLSANQNQTQSQSKAQSSFKPVAQNEVPFVGQVPNKTTGVINTGHRFEAQYDDPIPSLSATQGQFSTGFNPGEFRQSTVVLEGSNRCIGCGVLLENVFFCKGEPYDSELWETESKGKDYVHVLRAPKIGRTTNGFLRRTEHRFPLEIVGYKPNKNGENKPVYGDSNCTKCGINSAVFKQCKCGFQRRFAETPREDS